MIEQDNKSQRRGFMDKRLCRVVLLCTMMLLCLQCGRQSRSSTNVIQIKGSDTMVNLVQAWVEMFRTVDSTISIEVSGGGSGVGIAALEKGAVDIATASRDIKPAEAQSVKGNTGKDPFEHIVAFDALAIYVNKANPMDEITLEQLARIFGEENSVTKWSELGINIPDVKTDKIIRISRQSSSGTYEFFREKVLHKKDFRLGSCDMNGSKEVVELISSTKTAIGYSGMGYATPNIKMLRVRKTANDTAWAPTVKNTMEKKYPLARSLQMYTLGEPSDGLKTFIDWILSDRGQLLVGDNGFVPCRVIGSVSN